MKIVVLLFPVFLVAHTALSQELWVQGKKFKYALNEEMNAAFLTGDNFDGEPSDLKTTKIGKLELSHLAKTNDLRLQVKPDAREKLKLKFTEEGTFLLALQSKETFRELDSERFNSYLEENGS